MNLSEFIKARREASGLTLQELADAVGCTKSHIWEMENKPCNPTLRVALRLSVALGVRINALAACLLEEEKP